MPRPPTAQKHAHQPRRPLPAWLLMLQALLQPRGVTVAWEGGQQARLYSSTTWSPLAGYDHQARELALTDGRRVKVGSGADVIAALGLAPAPVA